MNRRNHFHVMIRLLCLGVLLVPIGVVGQQQPANSEFETLLRTAYTLYRSGKFDEALVNLSKASALNQNDYRVPLLAGSVYVEQGKFKNASEAFARLIQLKPNEKEHYIMKATADAGRSAVDEAIAECRKALSIDPKYASAYVVMGEILQRYEKRQAEAIAAYEAALKIEPQRVSIYEPLGQLYLDAKNKSRAEEIFRQGMAVDPIRKSGRFKLGRLLVEQGRLTEARQLWEDRTSDEDNMMPSFIELLTRAENLKRAKDTLAQKPDDPDALIEMGIAVMDGDSWVVDGRQERAIVYFKKALTLKPNYAKAEYQIVKALIQYADTFEKNSKKVDQELAKLRRLDPALAKEMEEYRKTYESGFIGIPVKPNQ